MTAQRDITVTLTSAQIDLILDLLPQPLERDSAAEFGLDGAA